MEDYAIGYTEVYYFINRLDNSIRCNIPSEVVNEIKNRMDMSYIPNEDNLSDEGRAILSVIYSNYLCDETTKKKWNDLDKLYLDNLIKEKNITSNINYNKDCDVKKENVDIVERKSEGLISMIASNIKKFFCRFNKRS